MNGISQDAVLIHDWWKAHFQTPVDKHQLYTAHLKRKIKYLEERYNVDWPVKFRIMLFEAEKLKNQLIRLIIINQVITEVILERTLDNLLSESLEPNHN